MRRLRIGFLFRRPYGAGHVSIFPKTLQMLADAGVVVDVIAGNGRLIDLSSVRVEHDLYAPAWWSMSSPATDASSTSRASGWSTTCTC